MRQLKRHLAAVLLTVLPLLVRCSSNQLAGGTETDNPEVVACAQLVFGALDDTLAWNVRGYVPGGMRRLDSAGIYSGAAHNADGTLAKRWVESSDTVIGTMRIITYTMFIDDTVLIYDTMLVADTVFIDSVLSRIDTVYDTLTVYTDGDTTHIVQSSGVLNAYRVSDTVAYLDTIRRVDTLFVLDTVVLVDTLPVDSSATTMSDPPLLSSSVQYTYVAGESQRLYAVQDVTLLVDMTTDSASLVITASDSSQTVYRVTAANLQLRSEITTSQVIKDMVSAGGAVVQERYSDRDGDGLLFGDGHQEIRFEYEYRLGTDTVSAAVDFSAGSDNTVLSLLRHRRTARRNEMVEYNRAATVVRADTLRLMLREAIRDSSLAMYVRSYLLLRGQEPQDANDDTLLSWRATAEYAEGDVRRMEIQITLSEPLARGTPAGTGTLTATIWMRNGSVGVLDNVEIDFEYGVLRGTYYRDGEAREIVMVRSGCCM